MKYKFLLAMLGFIGILLTANAKGNYQVDIYARTPIKELLERYLEIGYSKNDPNITHLHLQFLIEETPDTIRTLLATQGYFSPAVHVKLEDGKTLPKVVIRVDTGPITRINSYNINVIGAVTQDSKFHYYQNMIHAVWPLKKGHPFTQADWDNAKRSGEIALSHEKYIRARAVHTQAKICPKTQKADLSITYDSGPSYTLGDISITGLNHYHEAMVRQQIHLVPGERYSQEKLFELQTLLQNTPHFSSAVVKVDFDHEKKINTDHVEVPIVVAVQEAPLQKINFGLGYGSESGGRGEISYQYNNIAGRGWVLTAKAKADHLEKLGKVMITMPQRSSGYDDSFYIKYKRSNIQNLFSEERSAVTQRIRKKGQIETELMLDYTAEYKQFKDGGWERPHALVLNYKWLRRDLDNITNPHNGNMLWLEFGAASKEILSTASFLRLHGTGILYWGLGSKNILMARLELGQVIAQDGFAVPSKWLYRAGGSNSLRGYDYQSLGVYRRGSIVGGQVIGTGTVEYQHPVYNDWRAAIFIDAGDAAKNWQQYKARLGAGFGARWASPVGVFSADLARGFKTHTWRFYLSMGLMF